ncbi:MAG: hypothetical protein HKN92_04980 [Chitinophagales bacterium]|nr:hypothetical protein [Chitinophagales bacterium]
MQRKSKLIRTSVIFFLSVLIVSCDSNLPNGGIPSYVKIESVTLNSNPLQGSNSHNIVDIWLEAKGVDYGAYELPTTLPLLTEGETTLFLLAGNLEDGRSGFRGIYPFYTLDTALVNLIEKDTITVIPSFSYRSATQFPLIEDFEIGNSFDNLQIVTNNEVFEGSGSGLMTLNGLTPEKTAKTFASFVLPFDREVYVELNYKANNFFNVKLEGKENSGVISTLDLIFIAPKSEWNKIYIKVTDDIALLNAVDYKFIINAVKNDTLPTAEIYIDNFKIVHL